MIISVRVRSKIQKLISILVFLLLFFMAYVPGAKAAVVSTISDTMTRQKISTTSNHTIVFTTPTGIANTNTVTLTFPSSSFTMGASLSGVTIADNGGADNAVTSASYATNVLTITASASSTVAAGHAATIKIPTAQITNPGTAGSYKITIGGTFGDTGAFAVPITTGNDDQIAIAADIDLSITFALSTNSCALGVMTTGAVASCGPFTYTVGTTAGGGYTVTVQDEGSGTNPGLYKSAATTKLIATSTATLAAGTEGYGIQGAVNSGSQTIAAVYLKTSNNVGALSRTATTISSYASATSADHVTNVTAKAAISAGTPAGTYQDTLTFLATGNF
ncbi:MAG: hypothetical protein PHU86_02525 [Patescibacteria group bacterium]|nr:hypothetical protein [Patescibacteria group bacterium]